MIYKKHLICCFRKYIRDIIKIYTPGGLKYFDFNYK